jgi:hypothetical protein
MTSSHSRTTHNRTEKDPFSASARDNPSLPPDRDPNSNPTARPPKTKQCGLTSAATGTT